MSPLRLIEEWLPEKAKTKIRIIYGVVGVAAIAWGAALWRVPNKTRLWPHCCSACIS